MHFFFFKKKTPFRTPLLLETLSWCAMAPNRRGHGSPKRIFKGLLGGSWGVLGGPEWPLDPLGILRSAGIAFGGAQKPPGSRLGDSWEPPGASQRLHGNLPGAFRETPRSLWGVAKASREHPWSLPRGSQEHLGSRPPFSRLVHIRRWQGNAN